MKELIHDILASLEELSDPGRKKFAAGSYPTKMKILGVNNPGLNLINKELKQKTKAFTPLEKLHLVKALFKTEIFECQHLAFKFIEKEKKTLSLLTEKEIDDLSYNLDNWVSVDNFGALIVGYAWREGIIDIEKVKLYLLSPDFWIRRIAVVATVSLNQKARGGTGDARQTLEICSMVVEDHEDMINKALSWALRELSKVDPDPVYEFVERYKDKLHKRVLREVLHKLEKGTKN